MNLKTPLNEASRSLKMYSGRLQKLGIYNLSDLLFHYPFRYDNFSIFSKIENLQEGEIVTIDAKITEVKNIFTKGWKKIQSVKINDGTGEIELIWFNQPYITKVLNVGDEILVSGKVGHFKNKLTLVSPDYEIKEEGKKTIHTGRLVPVYPETKGVSSKWLRRQISFALDDHLNELAETLPQKIRDKYDFPEIKSAISKIHFPEDVNEVEKAKERLSFEELFIIQLGWLKRKKEWSKKVNKKPLKISVYKKEIDTFLKSIPFTLTNSQKKAVDEIFTDLSSNMPMNRLLEGEVGSGKTVVGAIAIYATFLNNQQSLLMAPTEILANQHFKTIDALLTKLNIKVGLLTSSSKKNFSFTDKYDVVIGTHALISEKLKFDNLGLVVIDEQQRFGVKQRGIVRTKGENPHILTMTATPIPRTVALTMYGDLDLSLLDEMPKGRRLVKTWLVPKEKRESAYKWIEKEIVENKTQAFIVCPFIEESESQVTVKAATKEFERLRIDIFPKLKLGLLHGKMKSKEKDEVLDNFRKGKIDILVSTPVVEVGIDISNATIMVVEEAERFGLAQLHQLRGRVGRGDKQSYCLLFTQSTSDYSIKRIKSLETLHNGAELAELDLKLRGPGQIYGTAQHGVPNLKIATFSDFDLIAKTKEEAQEIFKDLEKYPDIEEILKNKESEAISPD